MIKNKIMKLFVSTFLAITLFSSCVQSQNKNLKIPTATSTKPIKGEAVATFGEGCFWHAEIIFQSLEGVRDAVSGYAGGTTINPTYEQVSSRTTGHAEVVNVYYDPTKISYATLVSTGLLNCNPKRLPPGCTAEYRLAVESDKPLGCPEPPLLDDESRLNAFAVFAF